MANVLYVTCNVRSPDKSRTLSLGNEFIEKYLRWNPRDEVQVLDLYRDSIQRVDQDVLNAFLRMERSGDTPMFSDEERRKISRIWRLADQFARCDKYIFVTHHLNLWFPAELKMYADTICVPGRTYRLTSDGAIGLLGDRRRKSVHLHAGPSFTFGDEEDQSVTYLRSFLNFLGVTSQETLLLEGDDPEIVSKEEHKKARRKVWELAHRF